MRYKKTRQKDGKPYTIILFNLNLVVPISALLAAIHYWLK
jgi:hypothetical protein